MERKKSGMLKCGLFLLIAVSMLSFFRCDTSSKAATADSLGDTSWTLVASSSGTAPYFLNSWVNMSTVNPCAFRKDGQGFVHLRGVASGGNATYTVFYLPAGYRPANYLSFGNPTPSVFVGTNGAVAGGTGVSTLYLDGITFLADQ